jgi:hypothetical protein
MEREFVDFEGEGEDLEDFTNVDLEHFKRGGRDIPKRYRHRDDSEHYAEERVFDKEQGRGR